MWDIIIMRPNKLQPAIKGQNKQAAYDHFHAYVNGYVLHLQNYGLDTRPCTCQDQDLQKVDLNGLKTKTRSKGGIKG